MLAYTLCLKVSLQARAHSELMAWRAEQSTSKNRTHSHGRKYEIACTRFVCRPTAIRVEAGAHSELRAQRAEQSTSREQCAAATQGTCSCQFRYVCPCLWISQKCRVEAGGTVGRFGMLKRVHELRFKKGNANV